MMTNYQYFTLRMSIRQNVFFEIILDSLVILGYFYSEIY